MNTISEQTNTETEELTKSLPLHLPAYRKLAAASYQFEDSPFYSFSDIGRLIGVTRVGVRQRVFVQLLRHPDRPAHALVTPAR